LTISFIDIYEQLFNIIFETGIVPDNWLIGNIKPIYKNKGDQMDPKNYKPITILSCIYLQLYYAYYHSCYLRVTCTKDHLSKLCRMISQNQ
jgi:hypothetical protein